MNPFTPFTIRYLEARDLDLPRLARAMSIRPYLLFHLAITTDKASPYLAAKYLALPTKHGLSLTTPELNQLNKIVEDMPKLGNVPQVLEMVEQRTGLPRKHMAALLNISVPKYMRILRGTQRASLSLFLKMDLTPEEQALLKDSPVELINLSVVELVQYLCDLHDLTQTGLAKLLGLTSRTLTNAMQDNRQSVERFVEALTLRTQTAQTDTDPTTLTLLNTIKCGLGQFTQEELPDPNEAQEELPIDCVIDGEPDSAQICLPCPIPRPADHS